ncbi:uncharacterized protein [Typha angustifolia]|uniref:uncharacterized protein n=1 Tax=Typha angustifolia TaxID=59011 RepID=UPI003C30268E
MSQSLTDAIKSSPSSTSRSHRPNPSSYHGFPQQPRRSLRRPIDGPSSPPLAAGGSHAGETSESAILATRDSLQPSKKVVELGGPDLNTGPCVQKNGTVSECQSSGRERTSPSRSDPVGPVQANGGTSGLANSLQFDRLAVGSVAPQGNAVQSAARRSQAMNANYLLNFHYDPISRPQPRPPPPKRQQKIKPYNKDLFLQANYKFVVLDNGSYDIESMDPDKMLQWGDIICVRYYTPSVVQCPICLETPLCPQITSCGHIYCFPCILRYLLLGEEDHKGECWKKCPLCFMMISTKDLYTILIDNVKQFHVGDDATFTLLSRSKHSLVPSLRNQQVESPVGLDNEGISDSFSKFVLTSDVELSVREAKSALNNWLHKADAGLVDDLEKLPYVCAALEQLEERTKYWMEHQAYGSNAPAKNNSSPSSSLKVMQTFLKSQSHMSSSHSDSNAGHLDSSVPADGEINAAIKDAKTYSCGELIPDSSTVSLAISPESVKNSINARLSNNEDKSVEENINNGKDGKERDSYTFYQATDGQHLILHPLNMKCLLHHYGSYDMLPPRIGGKILELETVTQSEAARRRYRYLSHFSLTTTFQLCEIDLSDVLSPNSLSPFMDEIKKREKQRKRLSRKEQEERVKAEAAVLHESVVPHGRAHFSHKDVIFSLDDFEALGNTAPSTSPPTTGERKLFSDVTRLGFAAAHDSPTLKGESVGPSRNVETLGEASSLQGPTPMNSLSFANIISSAGAVENQEVQRTSGGGKKGKKQTRVLLSTSGGRRY